jgi:hypothetical protein
MAPKNAEDINVDAIYQNKGVPMTKCSHFIGGTNDRN